MSITNKPKIGVTIGDINGIGVEIFLKVCAKNQFLDHFILILIGSTHVCKYYINKLNILVDFYFSNDIHDISLAKHNIVDIGIDNNISIQPGIFTYTSLKYSFISLHKAIEYLQKGMLDILVTCPINDKFMYHIIKENNIYKNIFYFDSIFNTSSLMCMVHSNIKIVLLTNYIPIHEVSYFLNQNNIVSAINIVYKSLVQDFGYQNPKIAILGLNPSYDNINFIGNEEINYLIPAIKILQSHGINVYGPLSSYKLFQCNYFNNFDCIISIYYDQAIIPFHLLTYDEGIKYFMGLPFIITSPNHGVAYNIAGIGIANENSFQEAIFYGMDIYNNKKIL